MQFFFNFKQFAYVAQPFASQTYGRFILLCCFCFYILSSCMGPAEAAGNFGYLVVSGIVIRLEVTGKSFKELRGIGSFSGRAVLKQADIM